MGHLLARLRQQSRRMVRTQPVKPLSSRRPSSSRYTDLAAQARTQRHRPVSRRTNAIFARRQINGLVAQRRRDGVSGTRGRWKVLASVAEVAPRPAIGQDPWRTPVSHGRSDRQSTSPKSLRRRPAQNVNRSSTNRPEELSWTGRYEDSRPLHFGALGLHGGDWAVSCDIRRGERGVEPRENRLV